MPKTATKKPKPFNELDPEGQLQQVNDLIGRLKPLQTILDRKAATAERYGVSLAKRQKRVQRTSKYYIAYSGVLTMAQETLRAGRSVHLTDLSGEYGVSFSAAKRWLDGEIPLSIRTASAKHRISIPRKEDPGFAFLLGYLLTQEKPVSAKNLKVRIRDEDSVKRLRDEVGRVRGREHKIRSKDGDFIFEVICPELLGYAAEAFEEKTRVPWEHVLTAQERVEFAKGFLVARRGQVTKMENEGKVYPRLRMTKIIPNVPKGEEPRLFVDMQIILMKIGVTSTLFHYKEKDQWMLEVNDLSSIQRVLDLNLLPARKRDKLAPLVTEAFGRVEASFTPEQYEAVMAYKDTLPPVGEVPHGLYYEIADSVNDDMKARKEAGLATVTHHVDRDRVQDWLRRGVRPWSVKQRDAIREKEKALYGSVDDIPRGPRKKATLSDDVKRVATDEQITDRLLPLMAVRLAKKHGVDRNLVRKRLAKAREKHRAEAEFKPNENDLAELEEIAD
jgi:hypothetical protein